MVATRMPISRWMDNEVVAYINAILLRHKKKKEWNFAICSNMDGIGGHFISEISHTEKDKYCILSSMCGI